MPDSNVQYESGDNAKTEVDDKVTILTKLWKENGIVYVSKSTKFVDIVKAKSTEMKYYPLAHMVWESVEGSARGQGEVKYIIPNQIEINKIDTVTNKDYASHYCRIRGNVEKSGQNFVGFYYM